MKYLNDAGTNYLTGKIKTLIEAKADKFTRISTASTTLTLNANTSTVVTGTPSSIAVTLGTPISGIDSEYRLCFVSGTDFSLTVTAPSGYSILGTDSLEFTEGNIYEMSFAVLNSSYIGCICKDWEIS